MNPHETIAQLKQAIEDYRLGMETHLHAIKELAKSIEYQEQPVEDETWERKYHIAAASQRSWRELALKREQTITVLRRDLADANDDARYWRNKADRRKNDYWLR